MVENSLEVHRALKSETFYNFGHALSHALSFSQVLSYGSRLIVPLLQIL